MRTLTIVWYLGITFCPSFFFLLCLASPSLDSFIGQVAGQSRNDNVSGHVLNCLFNGPEHPLIHAEGTAQGPLVDGDRIVVPNGREIQLRSRGDEPRGRRCGPLDGGCREGGSRRALRALTLFPLLPCRRRCNLGLGLLLLQLAQRVLKRNVWVLVAIHGGVVARGRDHARIGAVLVGCVYRCRGRDRVRGSGAAMATRAAAQAAQDLVAHESADLKTRLDANGAEDGLADGGGAGIGGKGHQTRDAVGEVANVLGRIDAAVTMAALTPDEQAIALLEAVDPAGGELGGRLFLVAGQGGEDGFGLLAELFVGRMAAGSLDLLVPAQDELFDVRPVAKAQARAAQLGVVAIEAGVLWTQGVGDRGLGDVLAILIVEPVDAGLVARADGLRVGPTAQGAALVEREGGAFLRGGDGVLGAVGTGAAGEDVGLRRVVEFVGGVVVCVLCVIVVRHFDSRGGASFAVRPIACARTGDLTPQKAGY
ncbi:uncharacterized protein LY79DRAFT_265979 [Colletotrichum navitas]|uniref:Uncharacterized protein n=1 Tax=Colletotrichum navitas TaxID=681940 RepID=A0AAD8PVT8_9PEZI|nr:uncharacterized protein LY79DRAFT_265979 [Colletotrichum navitas]KAK1585551.1 hypothetical protein LY79DRAFT_265979 [Colletotrichum navitas]